MLLEEYYSTEEVISLLSVSKNWINRNLRSLVEPSRTNESNKSLYALKMNNTIYYKKDFIAHFIVTNLKTYRQQEYINIASGAADPAKVCSLYNKYCCEQKKFSFIQHPDLYSSLSLNMQQIVSLSTDFAKEKRAPEVEIATPTLVAKSILNHKFDFINLKKIQETHHYRSAELAYRYLYENCSYNLKLFGKTYYCLTKKPIDTDNEVWISVPSFLINRK